MGFYSILEQIHVYFHAKNQNDQLISSEYCWWKNFIGQEI